MNLPVISVSELDFIRLKKLLTFESNEALSKELDRADVLNIIRVPPTLVTMNSLVTYKDHTTQKIHESLLVYSHCPEDQKLCVSVQSPLGTALLGLKVGQSITWKIGADLKKIEVLNVLSWPE